jgi:phage shock protein C
MITGTAAGIAAYLDLDPTVVRVVFVALLLFGGAGLPLYLAAFLLIPEDGAEQSIAMDLLDHARHLFGAPSHA